MRALAIATILVLSSSVVPSLAQDQGNVSPPTQPKTTPVQPERTPQQSNQSRVQDQKSGEDVRVGRDWKAQERAGDHLDDHMSQNRMGRMMDDQDHRTTGRNWRMNREDDEHYGRGYQDEGRPWRRIKTCVEYENGDEYCRYRD
jgi:hypothetical protein